MKARFRKKSSTKAAVPPQATSIEADPFRPPPSVPSLDFKLPSPDFRSSRILPDLGKRFSLLARTEDPSAIKSKLAQLRLASKQPILSLDEEDLVVRELQQLREDQASTPGSSSGPSSDDSVRSPTLASGSKTDLQPDSPTSMASATVGSQFFGGLLNEAEYIRKAKRSASKKNLDAAAAADGDAAMGSQPVPRRGESKTPLEPTPESPQPEQPFMTTSASSTSLLSEPDSTVEFASLQDLPSPDAGPSSSKPFPPQPSGGQDRSKRKSLLDALSPAQVKRVSQTLTFLEGAFYDAAPSAADARSASATSASSASTSASPQLPSSSSRSSFTERALATVIEPNGEEDADEELEEQELPLPPMPGPAKRVPSSSSYIPGPRPLRNRSLSSASNLAAQNGAFPSAASPPLSSAQRTSLTEDLTDRALPPSAELHYPKLPTPPVLLSPPELDWPLQQRGAPGGSSDSSHASPLLVSDHQQAGGAYLASPLESSWASHSSGDGAERQSPSSSRRVLRGTRDSGGDTFFFNDVPGPQTPHDFHLEAGEKPSVAPDSLLAYSERSGASKRSDNRPSSLDGEHEELLDSHEASFAHRLPSAFDPPPHEPHRGPTPSFSSRALHGHHGSQSSASSFAYSHQHHHQNPPAHQPSVAGGQSWHSQPESADSDAPLPAPIEADSSAERDSVASPEMVSLLRSQPSAESLRSSFHSSTTAHSSTYLGDDGLSETKSLDGVSVVELGLDDASRMEQVLLAASGLGIKELALVHMKLVETGALVGNGGSGTATLRVQADAGAADSSRGDHVEASDVQRALSIRSSIPSSRSSKAPSLPLSSPPSPNSAPPQPTVPNHRISSAILDPESSSSTDVLSHYLVSGSADGSRSAGSSRPPESYPGKLSSWTQPSSASAVGHAGAGLVASPLPQDGPAASPPAARSPPRSPFAASPGAVHDAGFVDDFRAKVDAADNALNKSPSMPHTVSSKLARGKSLKKGKPTISNPHLISSTSKVEASAIAIMLPPPPPPLPLPETAGPVRSKSMTQRFRSLTGRRKSKDNSKEAAWTPDLPPSPTVDGATSRIPPSWPVSPQLGDGPTEQRDDTFRFPNRSPMPSRAATVSPAGMPTESVGKKTFLGRLRPRKTLDDVATFADGRLAGSPAVASYSHTAPLLSTRQFSGPSMDTRPSPPLSGQHSPAELQRSASFKSGHSHASSVHALFDAASKLGIDAQDVDALLRRSNSASQCSTPTHDTSIARAGATPPMTRAPSTRSYLAVESIVEEPREEPPFSSPRQTIPPSISAQSALSQSSGLSKSGSIMRRTVILPKENGRLSFQVSPADDTDSLPSLSKAGFPRSPARTRLSDIAPVWSAPELPPASQLDRQPSLAHKASLSPSEQSSFVREGHSSANASLFDLYHGQVEDEEEVEVEDFPDAIANASEGREGVRQSQEATTGSHIQPGQAIEILEMSNGDVLYSVLQGLRDIEDVEDVWEMRSDVESSMDRPPSSVIDEPVQLTFRGQRYDGPDLNRRSMFRPARGPRPETKIFYSTNKAVADLISEISRGHDQGQLQFVTGAAPTSPSFFSPSFSANSVQHAPLNMPKRSISIKRPNPTPPEATFRDTDSRFSDAPSHGDSELSVNTRLDALMGSVLNQAVAADGPPAARGGGSSGMTLDVPPPTRYTGNRF